MRNPCTCQCHRHSLKTYSGNLRKLASSFFPEVLSENFGDPSEKHEHFQRAWLAVCYRYRACSEYNAAFKTLLTNASDLWREWTADEEQNYEVEQCLYHFFTENRYRTPLMI
jgi:hypothetical protein